MTQLLSERPVSKCVSVLLFLFLFFLLPSICFLLLSPFFLPFLPIFLSLSKKKKSPEAQGWLSFHLCPPPPKSRAISLPIVTGGERVSDPLPQKIPQPLPRPVISFLCRPAREATLPLLLRRSLAVLSELNSHKKGKRLFGRTYPSAANTSRSLERRETATPPRSLLSFGAQALRFHKGIYRADWRLWGWNGLRTKWRARRGTGTPVCFVWAGIVYQGMKTSSHWKGMFGKEMTSGGSTQWLPGEAVWVSKRSEPPTWTKLFRLGEEGAGITGALWCLKQPLPSKDSCPLDKLFYKRRKRKKKNNLSGVKAYWKIKEMFPNAPFSSELS